MPTITVYDMTGKQTGTMELSADVFGIQPNATVLHSAVVNYLANQRQGTQSTKTRTEVSGGGRKPWKQKGTGHARQGSTRAPQWTHGGVAFAPKPRSYRYTVNKKVRKLAIKSALSTKASAQKLIVIDAIKFDAPKTKAFAAFMSAVNAGAKSLVVTAAPDQNVALSGRNLPGVKTTMANMINTYDILKYDTLVVDKASLTVIEEVFA